MTTHQDNPQDDESHRHLSKQRPDQSRRELYEHPIEKSRQKGIIAA